MKYIIIAYKPSSECISMGHAVDSYSDDFDIIECKNEEELIQKTAEIKSRNEFLDHSEDEYEITIIKGDILFGEDYPTKDIKTIELSNKIKFLAKVLTEKKKQKMQDEKDSIERKKLKWRKDKKKLNLYYIQKYI